MLPLDEIAVANFEGEYEDFHTCWTPLHAAACSGSIDMVKTLIEIGYANFKERDFNGWTPLHLACNGGFVDIHAHILPYHRTG